MEQLNLNSKIFQLLVCPRDKSSLNFDGNMLTCSNGHKYYCVDGIPVLLLDDVKETLAECSSSIKKAQMAGNVTEFNVNNTDLNEIDPYVQKAIAATNGQMWLPMINKLKSYPIPNFPLGKVSDKYMLDIGCNWGRWCISAAQIGYIPIGIDPSLDAIKAAYRITKQLGLEAYFVVGDARYLPFRSETFDLVFSYSVLQHFEKSDVSFSISEISRILKKSAKSLIQMPNKYGLKNLFNQFCRGFKRPKGFEVRYWSLDELRNVFSEVIGSTNLSTDAYCNLNPDIANIHVLPGRYQFVISCSEALRKLSKQFPSLINFADSVYVSSVRESK